ncbi:MAG: hypothetical protein C0404_02520 [Verrucomicrobia bacterium]|nr:hypothetical protein [Verrucomicrobiota bacterium]
MQNTWISLLSCAAIVLASEAWADNWQTKLQSVIRQHDSNAVITVAEGACTYRYHTQVFKIHTIDKIGAISETAHDEEGPNGDGILLKVTMQDGPYRGAAEVPQELAKPYWKTFINDYPTGTGKYLWMDLSYGGRADKKLIEAIKTALGPVHDPVPGTINQKLEAKLQPGSTASNDVAKVLAAVKASWKPTDAYLPEPVSVTEQDTYWIVEFARKKQTGEVLDVRPDGKWFRVEKSDFSCTALQSR